MSSHQMIKYPHESDLSLRPLAERLRERRRQARAVGLFVENRPLLECSDCGLYEDLDVYGCLYTSHRYLDIPYPDTGLRFEEVEPGQFCCPVCGNLLTLRQDA